MAKKDAERDMKKKSINHLTNDLALMKSGLMADMTIVCEETRFPAHKAILSARSEVFRAMFSHRDTLESQQNEVLITDVDRVTMERFLTFLYEATLPIDLDFQGFAELLKVAHKYQVASLTELCALKMGCYMGIDNAVQGVILGSLYNHQLKKAAIMTIVNSGNAISSMNGHEELRAYPNLLFEILDSYASGRQ